MSNEVEAEQTCYMDILNVMLFHATDTLWISWIIYYLEWSSNFLAK